MSDTAVKISVIVPTHNRSDALALTLQHLSKQDFGESWEAVVVNNNCTDDTDVFVGEWKKKLPVPLYYLY
jgi:glycosyltransferase involved in cell wall biosynthesis